MTPSLPTTAKPLSTAILISGGGSTLKNLIERRQTRSLPIDIRLVISSSSQAGGLVYAAQANIPSLIIRRRNFETPDSFRDAMFEPIRRAEVSHVVMGGYLQHLLIPDDYKNRVINIHPSLIPSFCGHGFYGLRVHQAAIEYGVKVSGCTVHFVDNQYDHGPVIAQSVCPVLDDDTPESLQQRVGQLERELLPEVLTDLALQRIQLSADGRRVLRAR